MRTGLIVGLHILLQNKGKILLMRRANTGFRDGFLGLPSGHLEPMEKPSFGIAREVKEELSIVIRPSAIRCVHIMHDRSNSDRIAMFFDCDGWEGNVTNSEPHKCSELMWESADSLPNDTIAYVAAAIECISRGISYSEFCSENEVRTF